MSLSPVAKVNLLSNAAATGAASSPLSMGDYIWDCVGTWSGATASLSLLAADGTTYIDIADMTANGTFVVSLAEGSVVKVIIAGGPPSALYSSLGKYR